MSSARKLFLLFLCLVLTAAKVSERKDQPNPWFLPVPNTFDRPGAVFVLEEGGLRRKIAQIDIELGIPVVSQPVTALPEEERSFTAASLAAFLAGEEVVARAEEKQWKIRVRYERLVRSFLEPGKAEQVFSSRSVLEHWDDRPHYMVAEVWSAEQISLRLAEHSSQEWRRLLEALGPTGSDLRLERQKGELVYTFAAAHNVAVRIEQIEPKGALTGVPRATERLPAQSVVPLRSAFPQFEPWPPTGYSDLCPLPATLLRTPGSNTLGGALEQIRAALSRAGIFSWWVYGIGTDGFAVVTRMECIEKDGKPLPGQQRWCQPSYASLTEIFKAISGWYQQESRVIVILVTPRSGGPETALSQSEKNLILYASGETRLPDQIASNPLPSGGGQVLVYQFEMKNNAPPKKDSPPPLAVQHLVAAGLWKSQELQP